MTPTGSQPSVAPRQLVGEQKMRWIIAFLVLFPLTCPAADICVIE